jgi:thioesterase domain-containing protein
LEQSIYIFSGLGANERVFSELDFTGFRTTYIKWLPPAKNQPIEKYASRLLAQITAPNPVLIGLSFGGMVAVEVAKQIKVEKVI